MRKPFLICSNGQQLVEPPHVAGEIPEVVEAISPGDVLRELLQQQEKIADILILSTDIHGVAGLVGTLDGPAETLLFLKRFEHKIIEAGTEPLPPGPRTA